MNLKENKNDLEIEDVSKTETNFRSLYGLTPEVELDDDGSTDDLLEEI